MSISNDSERTEQLLQRITDGHRSALDDLIQLYRPYLKRVVELRIDPELMARVDPSDVVQETQLVVARRIEDFTKRRPTSFRIWLRRKALEQLVDQRRRHVNAKKRSVRREQPTSDVSSLAIARQLVAETPSQIVLKNELSKKVQQLIEQLSEKDREILTLRHAEGLSNAEVAEILKIEANTVRQRYGRALRRLHQTLTAAGLNFESLGG